MAKETANTTNRRVLGHEVEVDGVKYPSKSAAIVALWDGGMTRGDIARTLGIRYQFANNVIARKRPPIDEAG